MTFTSLSIVLSHFLSLSLYIYNKDAQLDSHPFSFSLMIPLTTTQNLSKYRSSLVLRIFLSTEIISFFHLTFIHEYFLSPIPFNDTPYYLATRLPPQHISLILLRYYTYLSPCTHTQVQPNVISSILLLSNVLSLQFC